MKFTHDKWLRKEKLLWILAVPVLIVILVWTDTFHGLVRYDIHMYYSGAFPVIAKKYGPFFILHSLYSHFLNLTAWVILLKAALTGNGISRKQALALFMGVNLIILPNLLYISRGEVAGEIAACG